LRGCTGAQVCEICVEGVHGVALQAADLDGFLIIEIEHAGAFAENIHRADAGTAQAQDVGVEDGQGRATDIFVGDLLDETRHVDVRGAGRGTRGVETEQAAVGFY
jgi:hypothetical protein